MSTSFPIEVTAIDDATAHLRGVSVHVFCGAVGDDVGTPLERSAVDGCRKRVIDDERNAVAVGDSGEFLDVEHATARIRHRFAEMSLRVGSESL